MLRSRTCVPFNGRYLVVAANSLALRRRLRRSLYLHRHNDLRRFFTIDEADVPPSKGVELDPRTDPNLSRVRRGFVLLFLSLLFLANLVLFDLVV